MLQCEAARPDKNMTEKTPFQSRKTYKPGLVFQPWAHQHIQRGIHTLVAAIRPTLGPTARTVAITHLMNDKKPPEILDNGGIIARRVIELSQPDEDMGAMLARALICRQHERMGDGTATAAVLFQAVYNGGLRYLAAGGNAMRLRSHLQAALARTLGVLDDMTFHIEGKENLAQVAESICHDPPMAKLLGEIFDIIGAYGQLDIRKDHGRELRREYIEGMFWNSSGLFSREMITNRAELQTVYEEPAILIVDFKINDPRHIMPVLEIAVETKIEKLILVAGDLSPNALAGLLLANGKLKNFHVMAVKGPGLNPDDRRAAIEDLALLTGGIPMLKVAGHSLKDVTWQHFGWARRGWASLHNFGIVGGKGNPRKLRRHVSHLQARFQHSDDPKQREKIMGRIGKLMGGSATLWVGGTSELEIERRKELAEHTSAAMRAAVKDGVLPGGGISYLACRRALEQGRRESADPDERAACGILYQALAEPARAIFENAGYDPGDIMAELMAADKLCGFDVVAGQMTDMKTILDCASIQKMALRNAVLTAGMALTLDVLVHHKTPEIARQPG